MPDQYFPDRINTPHIHKHKGGITLKNRHRHSHKTLVDGNQVRTQVCETAIQDMEFLGTQRGLDIAQWIRDNILA